MEFQLDITGTTPLLMHSARLSNPLDPAAKALRRVTGKRSKTEDDHEEIAHLEFLGGLYLDDVVGPYIPGENIGRCLVDAGRITKDGIRVTRGVFISTNVNPLVYGAPRDPEELWANESYRHMASVKVGQSRTMRCRPQFKQWRTECQGILDTNVLDFADLERIANTAGAMVGLGDWRPRYGRFTAELKRI